jgi:Predicted ATP-binding protein involved in virulence
MKLEKLHLRNFRCFEDLEIEFNNKLSVIIGVNGAGKTTILEAAAIAVGTLLYSFNGVTTYGIRKTDAHNKYYDMGSVIDVQPQYPIEVSGQGVIDNTEITWKRFLNSENGNTTVINAKEMTRISQEYQQRMMSGDSSLILPLVTYYGSGRLWGDNHRKKKVDPFRKNTRSNGYIDCLDGTVNVKLMMNWFKKMDWKDVKEGNPSPEFAAVRGAMERCFTLMTGIQDVKIQLDPDTSEIDVIYQNSEMERIKIPLNQLSDGYKETISLIADIAYRMAVLNPWLSDKILTDTDGVVLIDEVDLHLHPAWQQRVIDDLTIIFPKVQFIVSTHAPAVINSVKSENLIVLKESHITQLDNQVYGKDIKSVLNEIMGVAERPPQVAKLFTKFYEELAAKKFDQADQTLNQIDKLRDYHDQEVAGCRVKLKLERIREIRHDSNTEKK